MISDPIIKFFDIKKLLKINLEDLLFYEWMSFKWISRQVKSRKELREKSRVWNRTGPEVSSLFFGYFWILHLAIVWFFICLSLFSCLKDGIYIRPLSHLCSPHHSYASWQSLFVTFYFWILQTPSSHSWRYLLNLHSWIRYALYLASRWNFIIMTWYSWKHICPMTIIFTGHWPIINSITSPSWVCYHFWTIQNLSLFCRPLCYFVFACLVYDFIYFFLCIFLFLYVQIMWGNSVGCHCSIVTSVMVMFIVVSWWLVVKFDFLFGWFYFIFFIWFV